MLTWLIVGIIISAAVTWLFAAMTGRFNFTDERDAHPELDAYYLAMERWNGIRQGFGETGGEE